MSSRMLRNKKKRRAVGRLLPWWFSNVSLKRKDIGHVYNDKKILKEDIS